MNISFLNGGIVLMLVGALIVLIGLIGGGIEIREIKIPSIINTMQRVVVSLFGVILLLLGVFINWGIPLPFSPAPIATPTSVAECPNADTVAKLMDLPQGTVQLGVQTCDFHWGGPNTYTTQAQCPNGYGPVVVQLTPSKQDHTTYIECSGTDHLPGMLGAEIFFQTWNGIDICQAAKDDKTQHPQTFVEAPARCGVSN